MPDSPEIERLRKARAEIDAQLNRLESDPDLTLDLHPAVLAPVLTPSTAPVALTTRYEILAELGRGGMGIVYRARDRETGELLAVKVLRPEIAKDTAVAERFKSELRLARQITHKNVCRIYDFNRIGDVACISMELVEGESLRRVLERLGTLSIRATAHIGAQICAALREAHAQGIVHRDMKPENVMLDARGEIKVMDFGIAQSVRHGAGEGDIAGTPAYMSPEQAQGRPTGTRTDIYAVGLILYEMLSGRLPFRAETTTALVRKHVEELPPPLRDVEPTVPLHLDRIVMRCLEKDPDRRFASVADLEAALRSETPADAVEFDLLVPQRLLRWTWADNVLLVAAAAGLAFFLLSRDAILPAARAGLQVDQVTVRREATRVIEQLGYQGPKLDVALEYDADAYRLAAAEALFVSKLDPDVAAAFARLRLPLFWRVEFGPPGWQHPAGSPAGHLLMNREGRAFEYVRELRDEARFLPRYQPPTLEERRRAAAAVAEQFCGSTLAGVPRTEMSGGESGASYIATWKPLHPPGSPPVARVALWAETPYEIACLPLLPPLKDAVAVVMQRSSSWLGLALAAYFLLSLLFWFAIGRYQNSPLVVRRLPLAVLAGITSAWMISLESLGPSASLPLIGGLSVVSVLFWLMAVVALEHRLMRYSPECLASWAALAGGRLLAPEVGFAILRGAALGLIAVGLQAAMARLMLLPSQYPLSVRRFVSMWFGVPDPSAAANAIATSMPTLYILAAVVASALAVGFLGFGLGVVAAAKDRQKPRSLRRGRVAGALVMPFYAVSISLAVGVVIGGLRLAAGQTLGWGAGLWVAPAIVLLPLTCAVLRYDLLTGIFAVATLTLVSVNTVVASLLEDLGNTPQLALFGVAAAMVAFGNCIAFRERVAAMLQDLKAQMR